MIVGRIIRLTCTATALIVYTTVGAQNRVEIEGPETVCSGYTAQYSVRIANETALSSVDVPLILKRTGQTGSNALVSRVQLGFRERFADPGGYLTGIFVSNLYPADHMLPTCGDPSSGPGFAAATYVDTVTHDMDSLPLGVYFSRYRFTDPLLPPGEDGSGSLILRLTLGPATGCFLIDSLCHTDTRRQLLQMRLRFFTHQQSVTPAFRALQVCVISCDEVKLDTLANDRLPRGRPAPGDPAQYACLASLNH